MKKLFLLTKTLLVAVCLLGGVSSAWAGSVNDLATISADHSVAFEDIMNAAKLTNGTLYDRNYLLSVGGNNYANNKGTNVTLEKLNCCRVKSTTQDRLAFKVSGACTLKVYAEDNESRMPFLSTDGTTSAVIGSYAKAGNKSGTTTFTIPAAGTYYIVGSGSDYFLAGLEFTFPSADAPIITKQPTSATYEKDDAATALSVTASESAGTLQYEWYSNTSESKEGATKVQEKSTTVAYTPSTASVGTTYYYCKVYDDNGNTDSEFATVSVVNAIVPVITYSAPTVTITCAGAGTVYYTTDGTEPSSSNGTVYSAPFNLSNSCSVRAVAKKGENYSDFIKYDCYVDQSSAEGFLVSTGYHSGTNSGSTWTSNDGNFTLSKPEGDFNWSNHLFPGMHGHKMDNGITYTLQPLEGIKITSIKIVGRTWLNGTAATVAVSDATPSSDTWVAGETGNVSYILTKEFTTSVDYGEAVTITTTGNQFGCFLEVYGDIKTYAVTYAAGANGTGSIDAGEKIHGIEFNLSSSKFTRDGFEQTGWAIYDGGPQVYALGGSYTANAAITLYPVWSKMISTVVNSWDFTNWSDATKTGVVADDTNWNKYEKTGSAGTDFGYNGRSNAAARDAYTLKYTDGVTTTNLPETMGLKFTAGAYGIGLMFNFPSATVGGVDCTYHSSQYIWLYSKDSKIIIPGVKVGSVIRIGVESHKNTDSGEARGITLNNATQTLGEATSKNYQDVEWTVTKAGDITITPTKGLHIYYITVSENTETIPVSTLKGRNYASFVATKKLDFSAAEGITAYIATGLNGNEDAVVLEPVDIVPAGEPIIVKTETKGATVNVPVTTADADPVFSTSDNMLVAGDGETVANSDYYYLASDLFHLATSGTLQKGKAYLSLTSNAPSLGIVFDLGGTTGISATLNKERVNSEIYNLAGQRVAQPTKGLYIVNGKKVVIK